MSQTDSPPVTVAAPRGNGYGIAALVLGIVAILGAFIPFLNYVCIPLAAIGLILGIVGLLVKHRPRGAAIAGLILSVIALILSIIMVTIYAAAGNAIQKAVNAPEPTSASSASSPPRSVGIGTPVTIKQSTGSATVTIQGATYGATLPGDPLNPTPTAGGFLILDVEFDGIQGSTDVNPLYVTAADANGRPGEVSLGAQGQLATGTVGAGEKARGNVGLDISSAGPYTVKITDAALQEVAKFVVTPTAR